MDAIENAAYISVGRACGFAGLAVFCLVFGLSYEPILAARTGAIMCLLLAVVLAIYAYRAPQRPYKRTELWLILAKDKRPPSDFAQEVIGRILHDTYLWFAKQAAVVAVVFWGVSLVFQLFGITEFWTDV